MTSRPINALCPLALLLCCSTLSPAGERLTVNILDRRDSQSGYSYVVPGRSTTTANTNVNCNAGGGTTNCTALTTTNGVNAPAQRVSYGVTGATLSLQLPDGRLAIVNCTSKMNHTDWSRMNQARRSCRVPYVSTIEAEFDGDNAKLRWPVSIDGKKVQSETYKILSILDKQ
jgi:hypothetical protein